LTVVKACAVAVGLSLDLEEMALRFLAAGGEFFYLTLSESKEVMSDEMQQNMFGDSIGSRVGERDGLDVVEQNYE
jgi:hypothetical protein